jgi:predicted transcriptional regulator
MELLNEIKMDALDQSIDIATLLRKCMVLSYTLKNKNFQEWVNNELNGYHERDDLPDYRIIEAHSYGHFTVGGAGMWQNLPISYYNVPDELFKEAALVYFTCSVSSLEEMIKNSKDGSLSFSWNPEIVSILRDKLYRNYFCISAYKHVSTSTIAGIISIVRTKVLEFVLEIQKEAPDALNTLEKKPLDSDKQITQIFNSIVMGQSQMFVSGYSERLTQSSYQINQGDWESLIKMLASLGINDFSELKKVIAEDNDSIGNSTKEWIKMAAQKAASSTGSIGIGVASELISKLICSYIGVST